MSERALYGVLAEIEALGLDLVEIRKLTPPRRSPEPGVGQPAGAELTAPCLLDCEAGGQQIWGQATQNLPQYVLRVDDKGDIYAEGVDELLYGRLSNVL